MATSYWTLNFTLSSDGALAKMTDDQVAEMINEDDPRTCGQIGGETWAIGARANVMSVILKNSRTWVDDFSDEHDHVFVWIDDCYWRILVFFLLTPTLMAALSCVVACTGK
jgi:hypothetical protein